MDSKISEHVIYNQSLALLTDLYQLTMVYGYWKSGYADRQAVFHLNFRKWPFKGGFAIHGSNDVPNYNASHGCVRVSPDAARWLNEEFMTVGETKVIIRDD